MRDEHSYTLERNLYSNLEYKPIQLDELECRNISMYSPNNSKEPCRDNKNTNTIFPNSKQYFNTDNNKIAIENNRNLDINIIEFDIVKGSHILYIECTLP